MTAQKILTVNTVTGKATIYSSLRKTSRALSGHGSDSKRSTITRRCLQGGGIVGDVYVTYSNLDHLSRKKI